MSRSLGPVQAPPAAAELADRSTGAAGLEGASKGAFQDLFQQLFAPLNDRYSDPPSPEQKQEKGPARRSTDDSTSPPDLAFVGVAVHPTTENVRPVKMVPEGSTELAAEGKPSSVSAAPVCALANQSQVAEAQTDEAPNEAPIRCDGQPESFDPTAKVANAVQGSEVRKGIISPGAKLMLAVSESALGQELPPNLVAPSSPGSPPDGTAAAEQQLPMIAVEQMTDASAGNEQNFPGESGEGFLPEQSLPTPENPQNVDFLAIQGLNAHEAEVGSSEVASLSDVDPGSLLDRTERLISAASAQVRQMDAGSVSVTLKPEGGTELSLHLRLRNGSVEAQAQLTSGDLSALQSEWPQLQERLARQGIHLAPLEHSLENMAHSGNNGHSGRFFQPEEPDMATFRGEISDNRQSHFKAQQPSRHKGWEVWA